MSHLVTVVAIATITSATTLSFTHHLLSRPWCITVQLNGQHDISYGDGDCRNRSKSHLQFSKPFLKAPSDVSTLDRRSRF